MSDETDDDKQYDASEKKLQDARKKGELPRSTDLNTAAGYAGLLVAAMALGPSAVIGMGDAFVVLIDQADSLARVTFAGAQAPLMGGVLWQVASTAAPLFIVPAVFVLLSVVAQQAFVVAPDKIRFKGSRISPLQGFKNKFGRNGLFEFVKSFVKLAIFSVILGVFLSSQMNRMIGAIHLAPGLIAVELMRLVLLLLLIVLVVAVTIGGIDFLWQRAEHLRKHRMSRKELMDELKQSDGDPMMKQMRRQRAVDLATNKMLADVPGADVVIVNPTHYAVALSWDRKPGSAPTCVAKGTDEIAARIRELAAEHGVPIHSDPPTARALHATVEIGQEVPRDHYKAVAAAIRFAEGMRRKMGAMR